MYAYVYALPRSYSGTSFERLPYRDLWKVRDLLEEVVSGKRGIKAGLTKEVVLHECGLS